ncbi:hypothetical protein OG871_28875 [Kitasatospora sp. NBC_00374]|uniref:hypothetical protein n=1 Tax=Kitasatospora sp. NBC_00374 TaxID=2975964 RepID=UPI0030E56919
MTRRTKAACAAAALTAALLLTACGPDTATPHQAAPSATLDESQLADLQQKLDAAESAAAAADQNATEDN